VGSSDRCTDEKDRCDNCPNLSKSLFHAVSQGARADVPGGSGRVLRSFRAVP
jgi:hypothetical protein